MIKNKLFSSISTLTVASIAGAAITLSPVLARAEHHEGTEEKPTTTTTDSKSCSGKTDGSSHSCSGKDDHKGDGDHGCGSKGCEGEGAEHEGN